MAIEVEKTKKVQLSKTYFDVLGICCSSEVVIVEKVLNNLQGIKDYSVMVPTKTLIVFHDSQLISPQQIVNALNEARLEASIRVKGEEKYQKKWPSPFAIGSGILLGLSLFKYLFPPLQWVALAAVAVGLPPILLRAFASLRTFTLFDINILVFIAVAGSIALQDYEEAATIVFLFTIAQWLESRASHKATSVMSSLVNIVPPSAILAETGEQVSVDDVKLYTIVAVRAGETIPFDGLVVEGECDVDEKTLTGESFPVPKHKDSIVWAGTINLNGYICVKTTALAEDCAVAKMVKLVEDAQQNKSKTQRYIDKCVKYYTPAIVVISAALAIVPTALRVHNRNKWYRLALVTLVSACPCALVLSTPVAMFCALSRAATSGLLFKGAEHLETLAKIKIMAFDKTGTITRGEFEVTEFRSLIHGLSQNTLLYWVSSIESKSSHPLAAALVGYAKSNFIEPKSDKVEQFQNFPGEGIYGRIDGNEIYIGNRKISSRAGCTSVPEIEDDRFQGKSVGYIFLGTAPAGIFSLSDVCRTGVKDAMRELKHMGIKTAMLTGDCYPAANHVQHQLGGALDVLHAELLPEDKARIIKGFQKEGPTAMMGDGLNDGPALATADIGISMGISGSALAKETGQVMLMTNDIGRIPKAARLAKRVRRKIIENMIISVTTKAGIVALAIAGHPLVWAAVAADAGTCLIVILNSMLLLRGATHRHGKKCCTSSSHGHHEETMESCCKSAKAVPDSDIESQKKYTSTCSSENNACHNRCCPSNAVAPELKPQGKNNCPDSIHKNTSHSLTNSMICSSVISSPQGHNKCSNLSDKDGHSTPVKMSCGSKTCGNSTKCLDTTDKSRHDSHRTCTSNTQSQFATSCSKTKCSDTKSNHSCHSLVTTESCCSKTSAPAGQTIIMGTMRTCGNNKSMEVHGCHPPQGEHNIIVGKHMNSTHAIDTDDHSHPSPCFPVQVHGNDVSEIQVTAHSDVAKQDLGIPGSCKHKPQDATIHCGFHSKTNQEVAQLACNNKDVHSTVGSTVKILQDSHHHHHHDDCSAPRICSPHIGGCCESFRRECCARKNDHFTPTTFRGGLSEIVIE